MVTTIFFQTFLYQGKDESTEAKNEMVLLTSSIPPVQADFILRAIIKLPGKVVWSMTLSKRASTKVFIQTLVSKLVATVLVLPG